MRTELSLTCWSGSSASPRSTNCTDQQGLPAGHAVCYSMGFANITYLRKLIPLIRPRHGPATARLLDFRFRLCVLSGRGLCVGLITRTGESYRVLCVLSVVVKPR